MTGGVDVAHHVPIVQNDGLGGSIHRDPEAGDDGQLARRRGREVWDRVVVADADPSAVDEQGVTTVGAECTKCLVHEFTVDGLHPQQDILHGQVTSARSNQMPLGITERSLPPDHFVQRNRPCHAALNELALRALRSSYLFNCQGASIVKHR